MYPCQLMTGSLSGLSRSALSCSVPCMCWATVIPLGVGLQEDNCVFELTYNWGKEDGYSKGTGYAQVLPRHHAAKPGPQQLAPIWRRDGEVPVVHAQPANQLLS